MKKTGCTAIAVLVTLAAALALIGCSKKTDTASATGGASQKVEFWNDKPNPEVYARLQAAMTKSAEINVDIIAYPDVSAYQTAIQQSIRSPGAPGLFTWWSGPQLETLANNGVVADLTDLWNESLIPAGVSAGIADAFRFNGKVYAAPWSLLYNVTFYNKSAFQKAGISRVPATFEEFLNACAKLKAAGITPIGVKDDSWASFIWFQQLVAVYDPDLYISLCQGTEKYTSGRMAEVLNIWQEMLDKGYFGPPTPYKDMYRSFVAGEFAMVLEPQTASTGLATDYGFVPGDDFDAFVTPAMNGNKGVVFFEASPLCIAESSATKTDALKVLGGFYAKDVQQLLVDENGFVNTSTVTVSDPVVKSIFALGADPKNQLILRFYENTPSNLRDVVINEMSRFMYGGASIDQILNTIQQTADTAF